MPLVTRLIVFALLAAGADAVRAADPPTVLITGSNRGIGLALTREYAAHGWHVIATARKPQDATELLQLAAKDKNVTLEALDVTDHAMVDALARKLAGQPIDLLIHNAGISGALPAQVLGHMDYQVFRQVLEVNTIAPMKLSETLLANIEHSSQKKIILIGTSEASLTGVNAARLYWYRSSKAAAHMLMLNLAYQLKDRGISVAVINPGPVDTDMMKGVPMPLQSPAEAAAKVAAIVAGLNVANTGKFWNYRGGTIPW